MTLTARIEIGEDMAKRAPFPPDRTVAPRVLDLAATYLLNEDYGVNVRYVYPSIGFDGKGALALEAMDREERHRAEGREVPEASKLRAEIRPLVKGLGLELIVGMLLSCLAGPKTAFCPCHVHEDRETGALLPYGHARSGKPDARADYDGFSVIAEVTSQKEQAPKRGLRDGTIEAQWNGANTHVKTALLEEDAPARVYCLMVSRGDLTDVRMRRKLIEAPAKLADTPRDPENPDGPKVGDRADDARFLVLSVKDMGFVGRKLHQFYCLGRTGVHALSHAALAALLDRLHAETMECIAQGRDFPEGWAGLVFAKLLKEHATGGSNDDLLTKNGRPRATPQS